MDGDTRLAPAGTRRGKLTVPAQRRNNGDGLNAKTAKRALEILGDALEMATDERSAFIDRRCAGDEELRREVLAQLEYHWDATIAPPSLDSLPMPELPAQLDFASRYELGDEIARGGVGRIIRAVDRGLGRVVAIKVLLDPHKNNPELVRRFITEARISGKLTHPGITPVHEIGVLPEGDPFIAMKLVEGRTLSSLLKKRGGVRDGLPRFLAVFENVCQTVAYAHSRGVIHRDLKPENVMVSSFGEVQVMDWGLAKMGSDERGDGDVDVDKGGDAPDDTGNATRVGAIMGTPAYMPPEQAMGLAQPQNDVFALGGILCEILTGSPPYRARSSTLQLQQATRGEIQEARDRLVRSGADKELVQLAIECLETEVDKRPADAGEVARKMGDYSKSIRERARKAELAGERARVVSLEQRKRSRILIAGSFLGFVLILAATIIHFQQKARHAEKVVAVEKQEREQAEETGYWAMLLAAFREFNTGHFFQARVILENAPPKHRNWEWRHLWNRINSTASEHTVPGKRIEFAILAEGGSQMVLIDELSGARIVDLESSALVGEVSAPVGLPLGASDDGSHFLSVTGSDDSDGVPGRPSGTAGELVLWETLTGKTVQTFPAYPTEINRFRRNKQSVSLRGKHVACISPDDWDRIILYRTSDARPLRSFPIAFGCTFSPDGEWFIYSTAGEIRFWDISGGREARPPIPEKSRVLRCSPDRSRLAGVRYEDIVIWDLTTGAPVTTLQMEVAEFPGGSAVFSADGKEFIAAFDNGSIRVWNPESGELLRQFGAIQSVSTEFGAYSWKDGCLAAPTHLDDDAHIKLVDLTPDPHRILRGHSSYVYPVAISSDGRIIISGSWDKTVRIWEGDTGKNLFTCHGHDSYLHDLSLNDNNRRIVSVDYESNVCLWDSTSGELQASRKFPMPAGFNRTVKHIAFTPDGKTIIGTSDALLYKLDSSTLGIDHQAPLQELMGTLKILDLKISPSGEYLGLIAKGREDSAVLHILDTKSLDAVQSIRPAGMIREFEFSPDESSLAIGFLDGSVGIWDFPNADQPRWIERMHRKPVLALKFTPDGSRLFSGGADATIRIWDTRKGTSFGPLIGHSNYVYSLAISDDGKRLVSGSGDGTVRVWDTTPRGNRLHHQSSPAWERD